MKPLSNIFNVTLFNKSFKGLSLNSLQILINIYFLWNHQKTIGLLIILGRTEVK